LKNTGSFLKENLNIHVPHKNNLKLAFFQTPVDLYCDMARLMADKIKENNQKGIITAFILPVGPRGQYIRFAGICNMEKISCKKLITINMDEFLDENLKLIPENNPLSFRKFMKENLFKKLDGVLKIKPDNIFFPDPDNLAGIGKLLLELGSADICFGGVGINGHIAFNEPADKESMTAQQYMNLPTRILKLARETIIMTSIKYGGDFNLIPENCITIGMRENFLSKELRFYLEYGYQQTALKRIISEPANPRFPASCLKLHNNCTVSVSENVLADKTIFK
jgi:glucosamine-6-phosphate deaminase